MSAPRPDSPVPVALSREGADRLVIRWSDGHRGVYSWKHLRQSCPCATCREERVQPPDPFRILKPSELAPRPPLAPVEMTPVGRYAYKIVWNDGHDTGLYTLEDLRALCECEACRPADAKSEIRNPKSETIPKDQKSNSETDPGSG